VVPALSLAVTTPISQAAALGDAASRLAAFDRAGATRALEAAAEQASMCRKIGGPAGTAYVAVTIATSGGVESVRVTNEPFEGTPTGVCIGQELAKIRVSPFSGSSVVMNQIVRVR
jgi:hypothetical protein